MSKPRNPKRLRHRRAKLSPLKPDPARDARIAAKARVWGLGAGRGGRPGSE